MKGSLTMSEKNDKKPSIWSGYSDADRKNLDELNAGYIDFLSRCKTERESVSEAIRRADYFIGGCSAPLHLAGAVGTPALALYGPSRSKMWAPRHKCICIHHRQSCWPCNVDGYGKACGGNNFCMAAISVDEALAEFENLRTKYPAR